MSKKRLRSCINWFGGKGHLAARLVPLIPEHRIYNEPWGGGASMLFAKPPSLVEVYNDLHSGLVGLFRVLRDPERFEEFHRLVSLTPFAREEYDYWREGWVRAECPVERAFGFFIVASTSFSGALGKSWGFTLNSSNRGMAASVSRWLGRIQNLPEVAARLLSVQVEHGNAFDVLRRYDTDDTFHYCDPPYVLSTRRAGGYEYEMTDAEHEELVETLLHLKGKVLLSGYQNPIYAPLEAAGWTRRDFEVTCAAAGRTRGTGLLGAGGAAKQQRMESVWANYPLPR
jgi:DNA adenine methylase